MSVVAVCAATGDAAAEANHASAASNGREAAQRIPDGHAPTLGQWLTNCQRYGRTDAVPRDPTIVEGRGTAHGQRPTAGAVSGATAGGPAAAHRARRRGALVPRTPAAVGQARAPARRRADWSARCDPAMSPPRSASERTRSPHDPSGHAESSSPVPPSIVSSSRTDHRGSRVFLLQLVDLRLLDVLQDGAGVVLPRRSTYTPGPSPVAPRDAGRVDGGGSQRRLATARSSVT